MSQHGATDVMTKHHELLPVCWLRISGIVWLHSLSTGGLWLSLSKIQTCGLVNQVVLRGTCATLRRQKLALNSILGIVMVFSGAARYFANTKEQ